MRFFLKSMIVLGLLLNSFQVFSQNDIFLLPVKQNNLWGFINTKGEIVIPPQYDKSSLFKGSYAVVEKNFKRGVIDVTGKIIIPIEFDAIEILEYGFFMAQREQWALVDAEGNILTDFIYDAIKPVNEVSFLLISKENYSLYHTRKKQITATGWQKVTAIPNTLFIKVHADNKIAVLDKEHIKIIDTIYADDFLSDSGWVIRKYQNRFSFYDSNGHLLSDSTLWMYYKVLHPKLLLVYDKPSDLTLLSAKKPGHILAHDYHQFRMLNEELIITIKNKMEGLSDWSGNVIADNLYTKIVYCRDSLLRVKKGTLIGLMTTKGEWLMKPEYDYIDIFNSYQLAVYSKGGLLGIVHRSGKFFTPAQYHNIEYSDMSVKCYAGTEMDVYSFDKRGHLIEKITYKNVKSISLAKRYKPEDVDFKTIDYTGVGNTTLNINDRLSNDGRFELTTKASGYSSSTKMKTLIPNNIKDVTYLFGLYDRTKKRKIVSEEYWDIRVHDFDAGNWARVILPGGRHAIMNMYGKLVYDFQIKMGNKYGSAALTYVGPFNNNLARVNLKGTFARGNDIKEGSRYSMSNHSLECVGGYWGFINRNGQLEIRAEYEYVSDFINGKAIVKKDGKYGVIDTLNQYVIKPTYDKITYLPESDNKFFMLHVSTNKYGLIDKTGKVILKAEYNSVGEVNEGLIPVKIGKKWGYADINGTMVIAADYDFASPFSEGLASVKKGYLWGFIDHNNQLVIPYTYGNTESFRSGMAKVMLKGKWGYINKSGHVIVPNQYIRAESFNNGLARVSVKGKWGMIDVHGKFVIKPDWKELSQFDAYGYAQGKKGKVWHFIHKDGHIVKHAGFDRVGNFSNGYCWVYANKKYGYLDSTGHLAIPLKYNGAGNFSEGLSRVNVSGKWGYINSKDSMVVAPMFQRCEDFSEGLAVGLVKGYTKVIDHRGVEVFDLKIMSFTGKYSDGYLLLGKQFYNKNGQKVMHGFEGSESFSDGICRGRMKMQSDIFYDVLMSKNSIVLAAYDQIRTAKNGYASFYISYSYGLADTNGKIILPAQYQKFNLVGEKVFKVESFDELGYIDTAGKWIWSPSR